MRDGVFLNPVSYIDACFLHRRLFLKLIYFHTTFQCMHKASYWYTSYNSIYLENIVLVSYRGYVPCHLNILDVIVLSILDVRYKL